MCSNNINNNMKLPVSTKEFWKKRLNSAVLNNKLHYSVYISNSDLWSQILEKHIEIIKKEVLPGEKVLDAGCGYGRMASYFPIKTYTEVDIPPNLLEVARKNCPLHSFIEADLCVLPFEDN